LGVFAGFFERGCEKGLCFWMVICGYSAVVMPRGAVVSRLEIGPENFPPF
jgi:hypothetical protein